MAIINTIGPIVLIISLGSILCWTRFLPEEVFRANNRLVYWVGLPCLLFYKTAEQVTGLGAAAKIFLVMVIGMAVCIIGSLLFLRVLGVKKDGRSAYVQAAYRGNLAYVGVPVILFAFSQSGDNAGQVAEGLAVLAMAPLVLVYNVAAVLVLLIGQPKSEGTLSYRFRTVIIRTITNPLIISCMLGLLWAFSGVEMPGIMARTLQSIAAFSLPLALFGVGASIRLRGLRKDFLTTCSASLIKVALGPLAGYIVGRSLNLSGDELRIAMIFLACPTAVAAYVMAEQLGGDEELTAKIIILSVLLSLPAMTLVLLIT